MASSETDEMQLKLLVDNKTNKVMFAEAGKDFVDLLFSILTLTISDTVDVVSAAGADATHTLGSAGRLYRSVADMGAAYLVPGADKRDLLQPTVLLQGQAAAADELLLARFKMYTCPGPCLTVAVDAKDAECPRCRQPMATEMAKVLPSTAPAMASDESRGFVKELVTYMVTDGLEVTPITSSFALISRFIVDKDLDLAEKLVDVGLDEGIALFEAALRSDTVLSDVFLAKGWRC